LANLIIPEAGAFFYVNREFSALKIMLFIRVSSRNPYGKVELINIPSFLDETIEFTGYWTKY